MVSHIGSPFPHQNVALRTVFIVMFDIVTFLIVPPSRIIIFITLLASFITQFDIVMFSKLLLDSVPNFRAAEDDVSMRLGIAMPLQALEYPSLFVVFKQSASSPVFMLQSLIITLLHPSISRPSALTPLSGFE